MCTCTIMCVYACAHRHTAELVPSTRAHMYVHTCMHALLSTFYRRKKRTVGEETATGHSCDRTAVKMKTVSKILIKYRILITDELPFI